MAASPRWLGVSLLVVSGALSVVLTGQASPAWVALGFAAVAWALLPAHTEALAQLPEARAPEPLLDGLSDEMRRRVIQLEQVRADLLSMLGGRASENPRLWEPERRRVEEAFDGFLRLVERHARNRRFLEAAVPSSEGAGRTELQADQDQLADRIGRVEQAMVDLRDRLASSRDDPTSEVMQSLDALEAGVAAVQAAEEETRRLLTDGARSVPSSTGG